MTADPGAVPQRQWTLKKPGITATYAFGGPELKQGESVRVIELEAYEATARLADQLAEAVSNYAAANRAIHAQVTVGTTAAEQDAFDALTKALARFREGAGQ